MNILLKLLRYRSTDPAVDNRRLTTTGISPHDKLGAVDGPCTKHYKGSHLR